MHTHAPACTRTHTHALCDTLKCATLVQFLDTRLGIGIRHCRHDSDVVQEHVCRCLCFGLNLRRVQQCAVFCFLTPPYREKTCIQRGIRLRFELVLAYSRAHARLFNSHTYGSKQAQSLLRRFDHISIYLMIAGSYTPICTYCPC